MKRAKPPTPTSSHYTKELGGIVVIGGNGIGKKFALEVRIPNEKRTKLMSVALELRPDDDKQRVITAIHTYMHTLPDEEDARLPFMNFISRVNSNAPQTYD